MAPTLAASVGVVEPDFLSAAHFRRRDGRGFIWLGHCNKDLPEQVHPDEHQARYQRAGEKIADRNSLRCKDALFQLCLLVGV